MEYPTCASPNDVLTPSRDFLLFVPHGKPNLRAIISYYSAATSVNQEGDVHVNDTLQGVGKYIPSHTPFHPALMIGRNAGEAATPFPLFRDKH